LALLGIAFGVGSYAIADGIRNRNRNDVIVVTGSAKKRIVSDYLVWNLSVASQQKSSSRSPAPTQPRSRTTASTTPAPSKKT
jgi:hypothetical protein